jgi:poly-beta-hydroxyalkanoate depolymerase
MSTGQLEILTETHYIWLVARVMHASVELIEKKTREYTGRKWDEKDI